MPYSTVIKIVKASILTLLVTSCRTESAETLFETNDEAAQAFYESDLQAIIEAKCTSCHQGYHSSGDKNYDTFENTKNNISLILQRVNAGDGSIMPPVDPDTEPLTDDELAAFNEFLEILTSDSDGELVEEEVEEAEVPLQVNWTAYKYPDRFSANREGAGVGGTFDEITYQFNTNYTNIIDILDNATINITTSSVNVANNEPERTGNVAMFFAAFTPDITGTVLSYTDTEAVVEFKMNGVTEEVVLNVYANEEDNVISLYGKIADMALFNWEDGYNELEEVCGDYHENKLWPDVDITAIINVNAIEALRDREALPVDVSWTAYKYPDRFENNREGAGVGGTFNRFEYSFNTDYTNLVDVLEGATINIVTSSVNVANNEPTRTENVGMFFAAFTPDITGTVTSYSEADGTVNIDFTMNDNTVNVTLDLVVDAATNTLTLSGKIEDMAVFDWEDGYDALELVCGVLHEGKLWEDVDIAVTIKAEEL